MTGAARVLLLAIAFVTAGGCSTPLGQRQLIPKSPVAGTTNRFGRVLVAGFRSMPAAGVDPNIETSRLLRRELRVEASVDVIEVEPIHLPADSLFDAPFWRRVGEEYRGPVIVTGTVDFRAVGPHYEERQVGRRIIRLALPQFSFALSLLLIDGRTGELIASVACVPLMAHSSAVNREHPLTLFHQLVDRTMPAILAMFGRRMFVGSDAASTCRLANGERAGAP